MILGIRIAGPADCYQAVKNAELACRSQGGGDGRAGRPGRS